MSALQTPAPVRSYRPQRSGTPLRRSPAAQRTSSLSEGDAASAAASPNLTARFWELGFVVGTNVVLILTASVTLTHLIPFQMTQQAKLREIAKEEAQVTQNIQDLQQTYQQGQRPEVAQRIAEEQGSLIRANQLKVFQVPPSPEQVH